LGRRAASVMSGGLAVLVLVPPPPAGGQERRIVRAAASPLLSIGGARADSLHSSFHAVKGAIRLTDGSIVVMAGGYHEARRFGPDGAHLWSSGRRGEGPAEFELPELLPSCSGDNRIVIHDRRHGRITILNNAGELMEDHRLRLGNRRPYSAIECSPSGRMAFTLYAPDDDMPSSPGPHRWSMDMAYAEGEGRATVFRSGVPGTDRHLYFRDGYPVSELPLTWGRDVALAATDDGVWVGTGDSHDIEFVDWAGTTTRRISWTGPALGVTQEDIGLERDRLFKLYEEWGVADWRQRFEDMWAQDEPALPARFPSHNTITVAADGHIWVKHFRPPSNPEHHWIAFDSTGTHVADMFLPGPFVVQQIGPDWVLVVVADDLGVQSVAVYEMVPR